MSLRAKSKYVAAGQPATNAGVTLFCTSHGIGCHWIRMVLAEKHLDGTRIVCLLPGRVNEDLAVLNPSHSLPTLTDRDAVIYPARLIAEFLDERYPHPPMMPPEPALRARLRMVMQRMEVEYFAEVAVIESGTTAQARGARRQLGEQLVTNARLFPSRGWFLGLEFGIADCAWAALLWRLAGVGLELPPGGDPIRRYADRAFARSGFGASLDDAQRAAVRRQTA